MGFSSAFKCAFHFWICAVWMWLYSDFMFLIRAYNSLGILLIIFQSKTAFTLWYDSSVLSCLNYYYYIAFDNLSYSHHASGYSEFLTNTAGSYQNCKILEWSRRTINTETNNGNQRQDFRKNKGSYKYTYCVSLMAFNCDVKSGHSDL